MVQKENNFYLVKNFEKELFIFEQFFFVLTFVTKQLSCEITICIYTLYIQRDKTLNKHKREYIPFKKREKNSYSYLPKNKF